MRATLLVSLAAVALPLAAQTPPSAPAPAAKRTVELTGLVLVNGFFTNARVNNSDVPQFADSLAPASAVGGTIRQTRLGLLVTEPDRKSTRLNSSHLVISYAVFCLKKKRMTCVEHATA